MRVGERGRGTYQKLKKSLTSLSSVLAAMLLTWTVVAAMVTELLGLNLGRCFVCMGVEVIVGYH